MTKKHIKNFNELQEDGDNLAFDYLLKNDLIPKELMPLFKDIMKLNAFCDEWTVEQEQDYYRKKFIFLEFLGI